MICERLTYPEMVSHAEGTGSHSFTGYQNELRHGWPERKDRLPGLNQSDRGKHNRNFTSLYVIKNRDGIGGKRKGKWRIQGLAGRLYRHEFIDRGMPVFYKV